MLRCTLLGHRHRFHAHGATLRWQCERGCGDGGSKDYLTEREAAMFAAAFDRRDQLGERAPLIGLFPLRLARLVRDHTRQPTR
ncbi:hypothetical protein [Kutzneria kofuensis]|uniref:Uncharacterized protein n=1 Tax=Kutzneria kofuensis TaxID=103725 RepID=A0A7W9KRB9_9PSEU|nr:hypothetical protein [Kutzneria kofuensis]MBB5897205.1 hypothetical protein [Kutzneria kofuensis]